MKQDQARSGPALDHLLSQRARAIMLLILTVLAVVAGLVYAQPVLAPVLFALVVGVVISPVAERLNDMGIPRVMTASATLFVATGLLFIVFIAIEPLLSSIAGKLPKIRAEIQSWIDAASEIMRGIELISNQIEETVGAEATASDEAPEIPSVMDAIWLAPNLGAKFFIFIGTLFFFVLTRADLYRAAGNLHDALCRADRAVSRYFAAVTIVNICLGVTVAIVMLLIGVDNAVLWGLTATILNFILYLGPVMMVFGLLVAGLMQFTGFAVLLPPAAFLMLNVIEAQFVTPAFVGQRLEINPLGVFLAIVFGLWLWGPVGAIIALPVTLWLSVLLVPETSLPFPGRRAAARAKP